MLLPLFVREDEGRLWVLSPDEPDEPDYLFFANG